MSFQKIQNIRFRPQSHFTKCLLCPKLDLNIFQCSVSLSLKMVSISSLKNLQKSGKCHFQWFRTFVVDLSVASKLFYKNFPMTKF